MVRLTTAHDEVSRGARQISRGLRDGRIGAEVTAPSRGQGQAGTMTNLWVKMIDVSVWTAMLLACLGAIRLTGWSATVAVVVLAIGFYYLVYRLQSRLDSCRRDKEQLHEALARAWQPEQQARAQCAGEAPLGAREGRSAVLEFHERQLHEFSQALQGDVAQVLAGLRLELELHRCEPTARGSCPPSPGLERAISHVDHSIARIRHLVRAIRPSDLDDWGLVAALRPLLSAFRDRTGILVEMAPPPGTTEVRLEPRARTQGYRVIQEALANIERHASATRVVVGIRERADDLTIEIVDDGCGFDASSLGSADRSGLDVMKARAQMVSGNLWILSSPGNGTRVMFRLPCREIRDVSVAASPALRPSTVRRVAAG